MTLLNSNYPLIRSFGLFVAEVLPFNSPLWVFLFSFLGYLFILGFFGGGRFFFGGGLTI